MYVEGGRDQKMSLKTVNIATNQVFFSFLAFEKVIDLSPEHFGAHSNLVILLDELEQYDDAEIKAHEAIEIFGDTKPDFNFHLANIYGKTEKYQQAEENYLRAIKINPKNPLYFVNFGVLYHRWKKYDQAKKYYKKALKLDPNHKSAKVNLKSLP